MSIEGKHAYRFGFLKSEEWELVRTEALVKDDARCQLCGTRSLQNDVHHLIYRLSWKNTKVTDLVTLCRPCHEIIHLITKPKNESKSQSAGSALSAAKKEFGNAVEICTLLEAFFNRLSTTKVEQKEDPKKKPEKSQREILVKNRVKELREMGACTFCCKLHPTSKFNVFSVYNGDALGGPRPEWLINLCSFCISEFEALTDPKMRDIRNLALLGFKKSQKIVLTERAEQLSDEIRQSESLDSSGL